MKSAQELVAYIAHRIGYVYYFDRPLMYGGTGAGVDLLLLNFHEFWAEIMDRQDELRTTYWKALEDEDCGSANFSNRFAINNPEASEHEIAQYVVKQWRKISDQLEVPVPHAELKAELDKT